MKKFIVLLLIFVAVPAFADETVLTCLNDSKNVSKNVEQIRLDQSADELFVAGNAFGTKRENHGGQAWSKATKVIFAPSTITFWLIKCRRYGGYLCKPYVLNRIAGTLTVPTPGIFASSVPVLYACAVASKPKF